MANNDRPDLTGISTNLTNEVSHLRSELVQAEKGRKRSVRIVIGALVLLLLASTGIGYSTYNVYDCTHPGGNCYDRANRNTAKAIKDINMITVYSNVCSAQYQDQDKIIKCISDNLEKENASSR